MNTKNLIPIVVIGLLSACAKKNDANEENFGKAVSSDLANRGLECIAPIHNGRPLDFPSAYDTSDSSDTNPLVVQRESLLEALEKAGLVHSSVETGGFPYKLSNKAVVYRLTEAGQKIATPLAQQDPMFAVGPGKTNAICYGQRTLDKVVDWTIPNADHLTNVRYTYRVELREPWKSNSDLRIAFPGIAQSQQATGGDVVTQPFRQTNDGWMPAD